MDETIRFSRRQGFYDAPFELKVRTSPRLELRYTVDGSEPTLDSKLYDGGIYIDDPTANPNVYSARTDTSHFFVISSGANIEYKVPDYCVDKCVPLRVASFDKNGTRINEAFATYFVDYDGREGYDDLYTVSLVTDPDNLFDYDTGVYVTGKIFDELLAEYGEEGIGQMARANYRAEGDEWEKDIHFTIFSPEKSIVYDSDAGFRIKGKASSVYNQKSMKLYAGLDYCGQNRFSLPLFGRTDGIHKLALFAGGQDQYVKDKDWLIQNIVRDSGLNIGTLDMEPAAVFLDGEYWGTYYLMEDISGDYFESHYGVDGDNVVVVKKSDVILGEEKDKEEYYDLVYDFVSQYGAGSEVYDFICEYYIDIDSFIDYYATEIYIANGDWPMDNKAAWRAKDTVKGGYYDGRWRWILFDVNWPSVLTDPDENNLQKVIENDILFAELLKNPVFQEAFYDKIDELERDVFSWENVSLYTEEWSRLMSEPVEKSNLRFSGRDYSDQIDRRTQEIEYFCKNRGAVVKRQLDEVISGYDNE